MTSVSKYMQYTDTLKRYKKLLNEAVLEAKTVNTNYQQYLDSNPYKEDKMKYLKKIKKYRDIIIRLADVDIDKFNVRDIE